MLHHRPIRTHTLLPPCARLHRTRPSELGYRTCQDGVEHKLHVQDEQAANTHYHPELLDPGVNEHKPNYCQKDHLANNELLERTQDTEPHLVPHYLCWSPLTMNWSLQTAQHRWIVVKRGIGHDEEEEHEEAVIYVCF